MDRPHRLADLLRQAYFGEAGRTDDIAWHGPSVRRVLHGVTSAIAVKRWPSGHSIWEITAHIAVWDEICARRLAGEVIAMTTGDPGDWPDIGETTDEAWQTVRARLESAQLALIEQVATLAPEDLGRQTPGCGWTHYTMIHGTLHHDLYHAGQIMLLRSHA